MLPSVNVPRALNCSAKPRATLGFTGVTVIDERIGAVTVSNTGLDVMFENCAVIVEKPMLMAVANPVLLIVATPGFDEDHAAKVVMVCRAPSTKVPVATNC